MRACASRHAPHRIAVERRAKVVLAGVELLDEVVGVRQVGVGVAAGKVRRRHVVHDRVRGRAEATHKDLRRIRAGHCDA